MNIGLHVSAAGGADKTIERAKELKCETFQFFSRSPQGGPAPKLTPEIVKAFRDGCAREGFSETLIHTPYFINLCSENLRIRKGSITIIREELERATLLGVTAVVTHLGAAKNMPADAATRIVRQGIKKILSGYKGSALLLLENSAGSGTVVGSTLEELKELIGGVATSKHIGVCLDTCHLFASGYDLRTELSVKSTLDAFDRTVGLRYLKFIHANDSQGDFEAHKDRHEHIGDGKIGNTGFKALMKHKALRNVPIILETNHDGKHIVDLKKLKSYRIV